MVKVSLPSLALAVSLVLNLGPAHSMAAGNDSSMNAKITCTNGRMSFEINAVDNVVKIKQVNGQSRTEYILSTQNADDRNSSLRYYSLSDDSVVEVKFWKGESQGTASLITFAAEEGRNVSSGGFQCSR